MTAHSNVAMPRSRVHYTAAGQAHNVIFHWAAGTDAALAATNAASVCTQLLPVTCTDVIYDGHDYAPAGSNIFNPTAWTNKTGTFAGTRGVNNKALYFSLVGRTAGACRARLYFFINTTPADTSFRINPGEWNALTTVLTWMNSTSCPLVARDGLAPVWKTYANVGQHYHYVKVARRG